MGAFGWLWFNDDDKDIIKDIAKLHKLPEEVVETHYKEMMEAIKNEVKNEKKD